MSDDEQYINPKMKEFLDRDCKPGEFAAVTIMINKQHLNLFIDHMKAFQAKLAVAVNGTGAEAVLGQGRKHRLEVVKDEKDD